MNEVKDATRLPLVTETPLANIANDLVSRALLVQQQRGIARHGAEALASLLNHDPRLRFRRGNADKSQQLGTPGNEVLLSNQSRQRARGDAFADHARWNVYERQAVL